MKKLGTYFNGFATARTKYVLYFFNEFFPHKTITCWEPPCLVSEAVTPHG